MWTRGHLFRTSSLVLVLNLSHRPLVAQTSTGRITGIVRDVTAGAISDVQLAALEMDSGRSWAASSDAMGSYSFPILPAGRYRVTARHDGFKTFSAEALDLSVNPVARLDITMEVGSVSETVEVTGTSARVIQTDSTDLGLVLFSHDAVGLPANGRNFISHILLVPGAISPNLAPWTTGQRTSNGGRPYRGIRNSKEDNNFQLDGVDANQTTDSLVAYQPSPDAIQDIHMITNNAPAEFGNYQGAVSITFMFL